MIASLHAIAIGYHGCERAIGESILGGSARMKRSDNDYDWLGHGAYFWESNEARAWEWAKHQKKRKKIIEPYVIGAVISLGRCFDLTSGDSLGVLKDYYEVMKNDLLERGLPIPQNVLNVKTGDFLLRHLDCAVIEFFHQARKQIGAHDYTTVRGVFFEGKELYEGSAFREKNHIQICVRDNSSILGFFKPSISDS